MSTNTLQSQGTDPTVLIDAGLERATLMGNQISNNSTVGPALQVSQLQVSALKAPIEIVMSDNTLQSQGSDPTVTMTSVPIAGVTLMGNQISNNSRIGVGKALEVQAARILMNANTVQSQADAPTGGPTVTINTGPEGATLTGNQISNNSPLGNSALEVFAGIFMSANMIQNQSTSNPTVLIATGPAGSSITGNRIFNNAGGSNPSLFYTGTEIVGAEIVAAITGNILNGKPVLPGRPSNVPPPMNIWDFFNTIIS